MGTRHIHTITQSGVLSSRSTRQGLTPPVFHANDASGRNAFIDWLQKHRTDRHALLVDLPDERFLPDTIPGVRGGDRQVIIDRRLNQHFPDTPYRAAFTFGKARDGRRDERLLLACISTTPTLEIWIDIFRQCQAVIDILSTPALLAKHLLHRISPKSSGLLICLSPNGIRQTCFINGCLQFSRLTPTPTGPMATWGEACLRETRKLLQYLGSQHWGLHPDRLPIWLLCSHADAEALTATITLSGQAGCHVLDIDQVAKQLGHHRSGEDSDSLPLFMALTLKSGARTQLASAQLRRTAHLARLQNALRLGGAMMGPCLATLALLVGQTSLALHTEALHWQTQLQQEEQLARTLLANNPDLPASPDGLNQLAAIHENLLAEGHLPNLALMALSRSLDAFGEIQLRELHWQLSRFDPSRRSRLEMDLRAELPSRQNHPLDDTTTYIRAFSEHLRQSSIEAELLQRTTGGDAPTAIRMQLVFGGNP
ncbi:MAG: hypothetical protein CGU28_13615 [Candidatus Dactylopiibacterium carminicum]|uniref:GspL cytoplasmic actin-ATPase-like domain-containing protein n=1 Tax=Candidatus Dactylopiibacterium carminicum TaxID=857335 RepID=A0A272ERJ2_9RHOO|nr:hypothetical protein [Candidatus Dactylopiibacterium carminicum]KAF7598779.1 hypothetical protein BGI27_11295 [Candidatus Dactylopiibacterium carminicum]PAS92694.1 MAG: hypothetical protein CGU29_10680 [Candidatus Dactylopiibacterium carminicum]PAS94737.1 MAG: hypothetical protein CGU28_13615 [Candidatus Dactylopiibacterium carminicum]PAS98800.1 MAG: hypothetical protein BSR46_11310 [Candidatus Dactylopiibacterium carminicum]